MQLCRNYWPGASSQHNQIVFQFNYWNCLFQMFIAVFLGIFFDSPWIQHQIYAMTQQFGENEQLWNWIKSGCLIESGPHWWDCDTNNTQTWAQPELKPADTHIYPVLLAVSCSSLHVQTKPTSKSWQSAFSGWVLFSSSLSQRGTYGSFCNK